MNATASTNSTVPTIHNRKSPRRQFIVQPASQHFIDWRHLSSGKNRGRSTKSQSARASSRAKSTPSMIGTMKLVAFIAGAVRCAPAQHNSKKPKSLGRASACKSDPTKSPAPKRRRGRGSAQEWPLVWNYAPDCRGSECNFLESLQGPYNG